VKTLLRAPNWVGDVAMSLPALKALRASFPKDDLAVLCRPWVADLYRLRPEVSSVIVEDVRGEHAGAKGQDRLAAALARERFDRAIVFPTSFRTAWTVARARIPVRIGYRGQLRGALLTRSVPFRLTPGEHQVFQHLRLVEAAGAAPPAFPDTSWEVAKREREAAWKVLKSAGFENGAYVALHLASFEHAAKRWDLERFAQVVDALDAELSLCAVLLGSASEKAMNADAASLVRKARVIDLSGRSSLPEVLGILAEAALFIGNDSGISHLAAAAGTPTVVVFGPTDPDATRPWDGPREDGRLPRVAVVRRPPLCAPCRFRVCPIDHACMAGVAPDAVLSAARGLVADVSGPAGRG
jgi:heptosyltransferase II